MVDVRRACLLVMVCALVPSCLGDLKPDVGKELSSRDGQGGKDDDADDGAADDGAGDQGAGDGSSADDGGDDTSADEGASADDGVGEGDADDSSVDDDAGVPADDGAGDGEDDGPDPDPDCIIGDSNPGRDVSFADDVMPVLEACSCHNSTSDDDFAIAESGLTIENYETLRAGGYDSGSAVVVPGNACDSIMLQKLGENPPFGERMPLDGPYLSEEDMALLSDWIVEGARDN